MGSTNMLFHLVRLLYHKTSKKAIKKSRKAFCPTKKPAYLQHPLYPDKLKVCTVSVKDNTSLIKGVGMSKVSVTFILVDKYGIPPSNSVNKSSIGGQFFNVLRPMLDAICKQGADEYDRKKLLASTLFKLPSEQNK